jgi:hypothetical protein
LRALTGPPMTLGNMRALGVHRLVAYCLNPSCRHTTLIDVSSYPAETEVPSLGRRAVCGKCGGRRFDVRPNSKVQFRRDVGMRWQRRTLGAGGRSGGRAVSSSRSVVAGSSSARIRNAQ